jgi:hypothetical protein
MFKKEELLRRLNLVKKWAYPRSRSKRLRKKTILISNCLNKVADFSPKITNK